MGRLLFNNNNKVYGSAEPCQNNCFVCQNGLQTKSDEVSSSVTGIKYKIDKDLSCQNGGIYVVTSACNSQYSGKTINFGNRGKEHFHKSKSSAVYSHKQTCSSCNEANDFNIMYVENYINRGKYSLSEREYFWNHRIKGVINTQKTLKSD